MIGPFFDMFTGAMFLLSSEKFLNMFKARTHLSWDFMEVD